MAGLKSRPEIRRDLFATRTGQKSKMVYVKRFDYYQAVDVDVDVDVD